MKNSNSEVLNRIETAMACSFAAQAYAENLEADKNAAVLESNKHANLLGAVRSFVAAWDNLKAVAAQD